ncbi:hypothetical protein Tsubulata_013991 [Turnera subulata]|uniref:Receptor-like serine/threonine-protein kinase n=1 Tax=Turnera subulata TaxID=218843 RepID=A0A9Q0J092_9ROSI|nr:hypothetical protein Tsubulata_013991 [Turnera subulata]
MSDYTCSRLHTTLITREQAAFVKFMLFSSLLSTIRPSSALNFVMPGVSIKDGGDTVVSVGQTFELGFFSPSGTSTRRYLGIWYKSFSTGTVVWVANRETPLLDHSGLLKMTDQGILVLLNSTNNTIWSSTRTKAANRPVAQLLDSGNLVVRDENDTNTEKNYIWQSFDQPTDTILPGMKIGFAHGLELVLSSWKSLDDPGRGDYTYGIDRRGFPQLLGKKGSSIEYRLGPWNGVRFTGAPRQMPNPVYAYEFVLNDKEAYYHDLIQDNSVPSRYLVSEAGLARRLVWKEETNKWAVYYRVGEDQCDKYLTCGAHARCNINDAILCSCIEGFEPKSYRDWDLLDWSAGCVRKIPLTCGQGEGFVPYTKMKLPDTSSSWYNMSTNIQECKEKCLRNCSCTAYTNANISGTGSGCLLWFGELIDMREYPDTGQDLYVQEMRRKRKAEKQKKIGVIVGAITLTMGVLLVGWILYGRRTKYKSRENMRNILEKYYKNKQNNNEDLELPVIQFSTITKATQNFSSNNMLGTGGFGAVYKGTLSDGQEIAVKRLSTNSRQGLEEFINEVILIVKLQHRNLVKLLGCCVEGEERMLVYEYMPNKSLDYFIFDKSKSRTLDRERRINIINGIARGLMYLHQDSRLRIIHRDLKASNILLDYDMNPKISDFGMARIFKGNQTEDNTNKVVGTYGYIAPEYAVKGHFSVKSDIFSFGVLAWKLWMEGRPLELVHDMPSGSADESQIARCIHIGLLCVQNLPEDRPNMSNVVLMLESQILLPQPKQPGFFGESSLAAGSESSSSANKPATKNEMTMTILEPR